MAKVVKHTHKHKNIRRNTLNALEMKSCLHEVYGKIIIFWKAGEC